MTGYDRLKSTVTSWLQHVAWMEVRIPLASLLGQHSNAGEERIDRESCFVLGSGKLNVCAMCKV